MNTELLSERTGKLYIRYLVPSLGGALATSVYSFVDTIAVGQSCGPVGAAAIAVINPLFALACFVGLLVGIGSSVLMSRAKGAGEKEESKRIFISSLVLLAALGIISWVFTGVFLRPILAFCGADDEIMPYAVSYMIPIAIGLPLFIINTYLAPVIRYDEHPSLVLKAVLTGGCFNIFGDWFFVFPLDMGMFGAGLATALGALIQTSILLSHFLRGRSSLGIIRPERIIGQSSRIIASGFGASILDVAIGALTIMINRQTMKYGGKDELAVLGVIMTISFLLQHLYAGIGQAVQPIASTAYGAGRNDRVWQSFSYLLSSSLIAGLLSAFICIFFPIPILRLFIDATENVLAIGPHIVIIYSLSFLPMAVNINLVFFLQSILAPGAALAFSLSRGVVISLILLYILPLFMGMDGILWAMVLAEIITIIGALPYTLSLKRKHRSESD